MKQIKHAKIGQVIKNIENDVLERSKTYYTEYTITEIYRFHVVAVNQFGVRKSFSYGELVQRGIEMQ